MQAKAHLKLQAVSLVSQCKVFPAFFGEKDLQAHKINPTWHQERKWESCDVTLWLLSAESHAPSQEWSITIYKKWAFKCTYTLFQQDKYSTQERKYSKTSAFTDECLILQYVLFFWPKLKILFSCCYFYTIRSKMSYDAISLFYKACHSGYK